MRALLLCSSLLFLFALSTPTLAQSTPRPESSAGQAAQTYRLYNPLGDVVNPYVLVGRIIRIILGASGVLALALFVYGGMLMIISNGDPKKTAAGKNTLIWVSLGFVFIFASYAIITAILAAVGSATS